ncbi:MAG TPA: NUDIX hydrolase [Actinophytocola sp.]|jgi:ADP-ribose pyrophosphatase YjhB (NUDIX family)|nr:NUDIX hydrolase [Actinophytocola sp.]
MTKPGGAARPRTLLEQKIREKRLTLREFVDFAENFARENNQVGTLSFRHLQRLIAGKQPDGSPLSPVRPATARLLEEIFDVTVERLLTPPDWTPMAVEFESSSKGPHPLTVAVAIVAKGSEVLVVCRRAAHENDIMWQFPAGVVKPGIPPKLVAVSETFRETGVHCSVSRNLGQRVHPVTSVVCDYMLCEYISGDATNSDIEENLSVTWVSRNRLDRIIPRIQIYPPILDALRIS